MDKQMLAEEICSSAGRVRNEILISNELNIRIN